MVTLCASSPEGPHYIYLDTYLSKYPGRYRCQLVLVVYQLILALIVLPACLPDFRKTTTVDRQPSPCRTRQMVGWKGALQLHIIPPCMCSNVPMCPCAHVPRFFLLLRGLEIPHQSLPDKTVCQLSLLSCRQASQPAIIVQKTVCITKHTGISGQLSFSQLIQPLFPVSS